MASHPFSSRPRRAVTVALAGLAVAAPAAGARPIDEPVTRANAQPRVHPAPATGIENSLTEEQVLASRGVGEERPVIRTVEVSDAGFDWAAAAIGAAGTAALIVLVTPALVRTRLRTAR